MDLNDLFDGDRERSKRHRDGDDDLDRRLGDGRRRDQDDDERSALPDVARRLLANKKLLVLAGVVGVALIALVVVFVLPLLTDAVDYVDKNGLKGIVDRVWQGGEPATP